MNITVYRLQPDCFVSFISDVIWLSNLRLNNLQGICFPSDKIRISIVKYHYKTYTLVYYSEGNTTICVCRRIWTLLYVDQFSILNIVLLENVALLVRRNLILRNYMKCYVKNYLSLFSCPLFLRKRGKYT